MSSEHAAKLIVSKLNYSVDDEVILKDIDFKLTAGEVCCLLGPSGGGKTTLLKLISGLLSPDSGTIFLDEKNITHNKGEQRLAAHPVMMVFQDLGLFPHLNIAENIGYGLNLTGKQRQIRIEKMLAQLNLGGFSKRYPHELSGGQQQRIALARALILKPKVLLLDEPFANLDTALRQPLAEEIIDLLQKQNIITLLVTHDREDAFSLADYVGIMGHGEILQWGKPADLIFNPKCPQVARFTGHNSTIRGTRIAHDEIQTALGKVKDTGTGQISSKQIEVEVLLRSRDIRLSSEKTATPATIIYRSFEAEQLIYALELENKEQVFAMAGSDTKLQIGDKTAIILTNRQTTIYPSSGD